MSAPRRSRLLAALARWVDGSVTYDEATDPDKVDWFRFLPFLGVHLACAAVIWVGISPAAVLVALVLYVVRMFAITGFYHRYFSHRSFRTSRLLQFVFAFVGATSVQRSPLWWAAHHRHHHRHSDQEADLHSPYRQGPLRSHMLWVATPANFPTRLDLVRDLSRFPELRLLDRFDVLPPMILALSLLGLGAWLESAAPALGTNAWQMLVWGFFVSTVVLFHATASINSLAHYLGRRRYATGDESRNSLLLALLTFGEGWHNNHHRFPGSARQGFTWWQVDLTYYVLWAMSWLGLVWDLRPVPAAILAEPPPAPPPSRGRSPGSP